MLIYVLAVAMAVLSTPASALASARIRSVAFSGSQADPTITVFGKGFGSEPRGAVAYKGYTGNDYGNALYVCDHSNDPNSFCAGQGAGGGSGDLIGLDVRHYAAGSITYRLGSAYARIYFPTIFRLGFGDQFTVHVRGATCTGTVDFSGTPITCGQQPERVTRLAPVSYTTQDGHTETLVPWQGRYVSVLVEQNPARDPAVMTRLVGALDRAWRYYAITTGQLPSPDSFMLNGRDEIAEVSSTNSPGSCAGAACSYLGSDGTEILTQYFEYGYQQIAQNDLFDQTLFYELGRNFWFWGPQLAFKSPDQDSVTTGFAVLMRFESMAAIGVEGAPYGSTPFPQFKAGVEALAADYEANPSLTFAGTLAQGKSPDGYGGTDFWASLMMQLARRHGGQAFFTRFFHYATTLPTAASTAGVVTNWLRAADYASCTNLSSVFYRRWGFPHPDGSVSARPPASSVPEPPGDCVTHGGSGAITTSGRVGRLRIDRSTILDVIAFAGAPDATAIGSFFVPGYPRYEALGYFCRSTHGTGLFPVYYSHGPFCRTIFYINRHTHRLTAVLTSSPRYFGPGHIQAGMAATVAERRTHRKAISGCYRGFAFGSSRTDAHLIVGVRGGHVVYRRIHNSTIIQLIGGRVASLSLESRRHPVGLQFC